MIKEDGDAPGLSKWREYMKTPWRFEMTLEKYNCSGDTLRGRKRIKQEGWWQSGRLRRKAMGCRMHGPLGWP
jgi:hypothetical protein